MILRTRAKRTREIVAPSRTQLAPAALSGLARDRRAERRHFADDAGPAVCVSRTGGLVVERQR